jgi:hypothetical protein
MTIEEFGQQLNTVMQKYGGTAERIPSKKESEGTQKVQFLTVNHPPSQPTSPSESSGTQTEDQKPPL